jgi:hypothetical protein
MPLIVDSWVSPVPARCGRKVRIFRPSVCLRSVAATVAEQAWRGLGVRVFHWPCGTWAICPIGTIGEQRLMHECIKRHVGTYGKGAQLAHVHADLEWTRSRAA